MKLFSPLYAGAMQWSRHCHAPGYLGGMSLANPCKPWRFALITTMASVTGGLFRYAIGYFAFDAIEPRLRESHCGETCQKAADWFVQWGFWASVALLVIGALLYPWAGVS